MHSTKFVVKGIPGLGHRMNYTQQRNSRREAIPYREIAAAQRKEISEEQEAQTLASKAHAIIASVGIQMGLSTADWMTVRTMAAGSR